MALKDSLAPSIKDFARRIDNKKLYVDKTDLVADLARQDGYFFLSRPRRFGKSMLLSTFEELFLNGKGRFTGLKLEKDEPWTDTGGYKVVLADFSFSSDVLKGRDFDEMFGDYLKEQFLSSGLAWPDKPYWTASFDAALKNADNCSIVLLIDEYDAPLTHVLTDPDEFDERRKTLASFFKRLKFYDDKFRFVFITGVTRITQLGLFSGPNNIKDISFESEYGAITGFTQEELEQNFKPYIASVAQVLKKEYPQEQWDEQKVLSELKSNYDGYSFDTFAEHKVYNPWSVINFFAEPEVGFKHYWLKSSTSTLAVKFLERLAGNSDDLLKIEDFLRDKTEPYNEDLLSPVISHLGEKDFPLMAVLYQSGYLTIKKADGDALNIGIPNKEVKTAFAQAVIAKLMEKKADDAAMLKLKYLQEITKAFATRNLSSMKNVMNSIINEFSYECFKDFHERTFSEMLGVLIPYVTEFKFESIREVQTANGRADLHVKGGKYRYIFEIKMTKDRKKADEVFEEGKRQFLDRKYADLIDPLIIVPCVMVIVNEQQKDENSEPSRLREIVRLEEISLT